MPLIQNTPDNTDDETQVSGIHRQSRVFPLMGKGPVRQECKNKEKNKMGNLVGPRKQGDFQLGPWNRREENDEESPQNRGEMKSDNR